MLTAESGELAWRRDRDSDDAEGYETEIAMCVTAQRYDVLVNRVAGIKVLSTLISLPTILSCWPCCDN